MVKQLGIILCASFLCASTIFAEGPQNAGVVGSIWYGETSLVEKKETTIHSGFYNQTDAVISGTAVFSVDSAVISSDAFEAAPGSIAPLQVSWVPDAGKRTITVAIVDSTATLESSTVSVSATVARAPIVLPSLNTDSVKTAAKNTLTTVKEQGNTIAENIIEALQAQKIGTQTTGQATVKTTTGAGGSAAGGTQSEAGSGGMSGQENDTSSTAPVQNEEGGAVLGVSTERFSPETRAQIVRVHDAGIDGISWVVRNWQWAAVVLVLLLFFLLRRRRQEY